MYTFQRYRAWLDNRTNWSLPGQAAEAPDAEPPEQSPSTAVLPAFLAAAPAKSDKLPTAPSSQRAPRPSSDRIEIEPIEGEFGKILKRPDEQ
jgi:hypothetical protein